MRTASILAAALLSALPAHAASLDRVSLDRAFLYFEENIGQESADVRFIVRGVRTPTFLTNDSLVSINEMGFPSAIRFAPTGSQHRVRVLDPWPGKLNRLTGDLIRWRRAIPAHRRLQYAGIHSNIDVTTGLSFESPGRTVLTLTFAVQPGGDTEALFLETTDTLYESRRLKAWQESLAGQVPVDAILVPASPNRARFQVGAYDRSRPLFIDFGRGYVADFPGGSSKPGPSGNTYLAGGISSWDVCGIKFGVRTLCSDAIVAAVQPDGEPIFVTVLAGALDDSAAHLALDSASNLIVAGSSRSADFPTTPDAYQRSNGGPVEPGRFPGDLVVARVDHRNGDLLSSTFYGGLEGESPAALDVGSDDSATILLGTSVIRFEAGLARLRFAAKLAEQTSIESMAVHPDLSVYLAGAAYEGAPVTPGALQTATGGSRDAYLIRLDANGSRLLFATFYGGEESEAFRSVAVDSKGNAWLFGSSYPQRYNPSQTGSDFLIRILADGSKIIDARFYPGHGQSESRITVDGQDHVWITGSRASPILETTPDALIRASCSSLRDYVEVRGDRGALRFASFLPYSPSGGSGNFAPVGPGAQRIQGNELQSLNLLTATPFSVACVTGAASRQNEGVVVPGQIVTLLGSGIGPDAGVATHPTSGRYPDAIAGVKVLVDGAPAPLLYVQASQINAVVPYATTAGKPVTVAVEYQGRKATTVTAEGWPSMISVFTADGSGSGFAAALNQDGTLNSPANPAARGSVVALYATGAGLTDPQSVDGAVTPLGPPEALPRLATPVRAGTRIASEFDWDVLYAGAAPGLISGLTQINVRIPEDLEWDFPIVEVRLKGSAGDECSAFLSVR